MTWPPARPDEQPAGGSSRILGIDPGSIATGWGLVGGTAARPTLLDCGVIRLHGGALAARLAHLRREFDQLVGRLEPTAAAVEAPFQGPNARAALQLAHARGVILAGLGELGLDVAEYPPASVKKSVTGSGRAPKGQVHAMVARLLRARVEAPLADLSDALAVALCHLACRGFHERVARSTAASLRTARGRKAGESRP